jgi:hypothetical protein
MASSVKLTLNLMALLCSELPDLEGCHSGMDTIMLLKFKDNMMLIKAFIKTCSTLIERKRQEYTAIKAHTV